MKRKARVEGKSYTYRFLWNASQLLMQVAVEPTTARPGYFYLSAMVMTFFTLEAYLNHLGEIVSPGVWKKERDFFKRDPYRGTLGKLNFLADQCQTRFGKEKRPYKTLKQLHDLRDFIAHGKTETISKEVKHTVGQLPRFEESFLVKQISKPKARIALEDTEQVIRQLHEAAITMFSRSRRDVVSQLGEDPFGHLMGYQIA